MLSIFNWTCDNLWKSKMASLAILIFEEVVDHPSNLSARTRGVRKLSLNCPFAGRNNNKFDLLSSPGN